MRYRKKAVEVEAIQYNGRNCGTVASFAGIANMSCASAHEDGGSFEIPEIHAALRPGDWIVRFEDGDVSPYAGSLFAAIFEPVPATEAVGLAS